MNVADIYSILIDRSAEIPTIALCREDGSIAAKYPVRMKESTRSIDGKVERFAFNRERIEAPKPEQIQFAGEGFPQGSRKKGYHRKPHGKSVTAPPRIVALFSRAAKKYRVGDTETAYKIARGSNIGIDTILKIGEKNKNYIGKFSLERVRKFVAQHPNL